MLAHQRGVAIITAMLVVALVTSIATTLLLQNEMRIRQLENQQALVQAELLSQAGLDLARVVLVEHASTLDHPGELATLALPLTVIEGAELSGKITRQQASSSFLVDTHVQIGNIKLDRQTLVEQEK